MKTLICIDNHSYSAANYEMITHINSYLNDYLEEIAFASLDQTVPFIDINTAIYQPNEMDSFKDGVIIASNIDNAKSILGCVNNSHKVLYLYDLDWMFARYTYDNLYAICSNPNLKIIVRTKHHVSPLKNLCNREPDVIEKFNLEKIWNLL